MGSRASIFSPSKHQLRWTQQRQQLRQAVAQRRRTRHYPRPPPAKPPRRRALPPSWRQSCWRGKIHAMRIRLITLGSGMCLRLPLKRSSGGAFVLEVPRLGISLKQRLLTRRRRCCGDDESCLRRFSDCSMPPQKQFTQVQARACLLDGKCELE